MKILKVLHLTFDMRIGGTEQVIKNLVENADPNIIESSILCIESPLGPFADDLVAKGITITSLSRTPGFDYKLIKQIRRHIKESNIDILHCHQYTPWVYGAIAAFATKTKIVFTEHGRFYPDSSSKKRNFINPYLHKITNATTVISNATKEALSIYENLPINDIQVIYNGISPVTIDQKIVAELRLQLNISNKTLCFGTVARLDPIKNHAMMLKAFKQTLDRGVDARLLIVGDGEMRKPISKLISELSIESKVTMTGYQLAPQNYLALMDIYLLSSLSEGTSMTLLEAMSIGKPCIVTDAGGNPEIISNNVNGLVTPNDDEGSFANAIISLAYNQQKRAEMSGSALQRFEEMFSAKSMSSNFQQVYENI